MIPHLISVHTHIHGLFPTHIMTTCYVYDKKNAYLLTQSMETNVSQTPSNSDWQLKVLTRRPHIGQQAIEEENTLAFNTKTSTRQQATYYFHKRKHQQLTILLLKGAYDKSNEPHDS